MKTIGIVICDDQKVVHEEVENLLLEYKQKTSCHYKLYKCISAQALLEFSEDYEILLLDIDMPQMDGIQAAKELAKRGKSKHIIMLTSKRERFKEGFKIGAKRFVTKPIEKEELFEALNQAFTSFVGYEMIRVKYKGKECLLRQRDIFIIEAKIDYLKIYTRNRIFEDSRTLKLFYNELDDRIFISVHRSYIVNLLYVNNFGKGYVKMDNGDKIPVSRRKSNEVLKKVIDFDLNGVCSRDN